MYIPPCVYYIYIGSKTISDFTKTPQFDIGNLTQLKDTQDATATFSTKYFNDRDTSITEPYHENNDLECLVYEISQCALKSTKK